MTHAVSRAYNDIYRWLDNQPHAQTLPPHILAKIDLIQRHDAARHVEVQTQFDLFEIEEARDQLQPKLNEYQRRREAELELADYIEDVSLLAGRVDLLDIANRLRNCRQTGTVGLQDDGRLIMMWDQKCGLTRLCPDESREETQRLARFYQPALVEYKKSDPRHRIFYCVFTTHNYAPGWLQFGKRDVIARFNRWVEAYNNNGAYCPVKFVEQHGETRAIKSRVRDIVKPRNVIRGSLLIEEDPLGRNCDWNVHVNVMLCVRGAFDYAIARELFGSNVFFRELSGDENTIRRALLEAIKYSARAVPEKSADHAERDANTYDGTDGGDGRGIEAAPAMTQWPWQRFVEWWDAQFCGKTDEGRRTPFRRVRAYGCLYALYGRRWDAMGHGERKQVCIDAELTPDQCNALKHVAWKQVGDGLSKRDRERLRSKLRHAMVHGEKLDQRSVRWLGEIKFTGGKYVVDLIQGHNFLRSPRALNNFYHERPPDG